MTRRLHMLWLGTAASVLLVGLTAQFVRADIIIPDTHKRPHTVHIDLGAYAEVLPQRHTVKAGDTFMGIARTLLNDAKRWKEIEALNPTLDSQRLTVGTILAVPARRAAQPASKPEVAGGPRHHWEFFTNEMGWNSTTDLPKNRILQSRYRMARLFAVRHDKLETYKALCKKDDYWVGARVWSFGKDPEIHRKSLPAWFAIGPVSSFGAVPDADPVYSIVERVRITGIRDGIIRTKQLSRKSYDAAGKEITPKAAKAKAERRNWILLLLGSTGILGLCALVMRRRRLLAPAVASLLCLPLLAPPASADLPIPGQHGQTTTVTLNFGPYADYTTGLYKIAADDTLQSIAQARLGASSRWSEIQALNPDAKPKKLAIGSVLLLPPIKAPLPGPKTATKREARAPKVATGRQHWWHLYSAPRVSAKVHRFAHGQKSRSTTTTRRCSPYATTASRPSRVSSRSTRAVSLAPSVYYASRRLIGSPPPKACTWVAAARRTAIRSGASRRTCASPPSPVAASTRRSSSRATSTGTARSSPRRRSRARSKG